MRSPVALIPALLALITTAELVVLVRTPPRALVVARAQTPATPPVPTDTLGLEPDFLARMTPDDVARGAAALCALDPADPLRPDDAARARIATLAQAGAAQRAALGEAKMALRAKHLTELERWAEVVARYPALRELPR